MLLNLQRNIDGGRIDIGQFFQDNINTLLFFWPATVLIPIILGQQVIFFNNMRLIAILPDSLHREIFTLNLSLPLINYED